MALNSNYSQKLKTKCIGLKSLFKPDTLLFLDLLVVLFLIAAASFYFFWPEGDIQEHIYASYMVSQGEVPYRDFFEHHHPLLWYLMAPLTNAIGRNIAVVGIMGGCTFIFFVLGLVFVYKIISEFIANRTTALFSVIVLLLPNVFLYYIYFKPDNYMFTCMAIGIYYFFSYMRDKKKSYLIYSYLGFWCAFLFTQKALFYFPIVAAISLYMLAFKQMKWSDFAWATLLPLLSALAFIGYMFYENALSSYFKLNFLFNRKMVELFQVYMLDINRAWTLAYIFIGSAIFFSLFLYLNLGKYFQILCWFFVISLITKICYFAPHVYYYYETFFFAVPIAFIGLNKLAEKTKVLVWLLLLEVLVYSAFMICYLISDLSYNKKITNLNEYIINHSNACDFVLNGRGGNLALFNKNPAYYWFILGRLDFIGQEIGIHEPQDLNQLIREYKPKYIWVEDIYSYFNRKQLVYSFDMTLVDTFYSPLFTKDVDFDFKEMKEIKLPYPEGLYVLKPEYQKRNCHFDAKLGKWRYE